MGRVAVLGPLAAAVKVLHQNGPAMPSLERSVGCVQMSTLGVWIRLADELNLVGISERVSNDPDAATRADGPGLDIWPQRDWQCSRLV